jgi:hypothetical protein
MTINSESIVKDCDDEEEIDTRRKGGKDIDTYYSSMDGTLVSTSPKSSKFPKETMYSVPNMPYLDHKIFVPSAFQFESTNNNLSSITDVGMSDDEDK